MGPYWGQSLCMSRSSIFSKYMLVLRWEDFICEDRRIHVFWFILFRSNTRMRIDAKPRRTNWIPGRSALNWRRRSRFVTTHFLSFYVQPPTSIRGHICPLVRPLVRWSVTQTLKPHKTAPFFKSVTSLAFLLSFAFSHSLINSFIDSIMESSKTYIHAFLIS